MFETMAAAMTAVAVRDGEVGQLLCMHVLIICFGQIVSLSLSEFAITCFWLDHKTKRMSGCLCDVTCSAHQIASSLLN